MRFSFRQLPMKIERYRARSPTRFSLSGKNKKLEGFFYETRIFLTLTTKQATIRESD